MLYIDKITNYLKNIKTKSSDKQIKKEQKNIWHDKNELPDLVRPIVFKTYKLNSLFCCTAVYYSYENLKCVCDDWAYIDELISFYEENGY